MTKEILYPGKSEHISFLLINEFTSCQTVMHKANIHPPLIKWALNYKSLNFDL